mgnify:CR=1 FL=1
MPGSPCRRCGLPTCAYIEAEPFAGDEYVVLCRPCYDHLDRSEDELARRLDREAEMGAWLNYDESREEY